MAQRARETHAAVTSGHHANHGSRIDERERVCRIVQIDGARLDADEDRLRHHVDVDFQSGGQRRRRAHATADAAIGRARNRLMQSQRVAPEALVTESVEAKDLLAPGE